MRRSLVAAPAVALALLVPLVSDAQDATPAAEAIACTVEPRPVPEIVAMFFDPGGAPIATPFPAEPVAAEGELPLGEPADAETVAAIDATLREWMACFGGGHLARGFALMTDDIAREFGPDLANPAEDSAAEVTALLEAQIAGTPVAGDGGNGMPELVGPRDARILPDGRAAGIWEDREFTAFVVFAQQDGRWLIDAIIEIEGDATAAATPGA